MDKILVNLLGRLQSRRFIRDISQRKLAGALSQTIKFPKVSEARNSQLDGSRNTKNTVKTGYTVQCPPLAMRGFSGLRGDNALDRALRPKLDFHSESASQKGKSIQAVAKDMFGNFTGSAIKSILQAQYESRRLGHNVVGTGEILLGVIGEGSGIGAMVLKSMGISLLDACVAVHNIVEKESGIAEIEIPFSTCAKHVFNLAREEARTLGHGYVGSEHLLLGLIREDQGRTSRILKSLKADPTEIRKQVSLTFVTGFIVGIISFPTEIRKQVIRMVGEQSGGVGAGGGRGSSDTKMQTLEEFGTNLTKLAEEGKLDPVIGRQIQIQRAVEILGRRKKNNPCLIGDPGVGKTAIAEGLAQIIVNKEAPETLEGKKVISLDMGRLVAGTEYRGEFEERLKNLVDEVRQAGDIILFIDEVHTLIGAGDCEGGLDAANILKPALARGELQCIGATTLDEYRMHIEKDPALERRFQPIQVPEPSVGETIQILMGLRERYEIHHKVRFTNDAIVAAAELAHQYISDRFLPDKAIDLIDEGGSRVRLCHAQQQEEVKVLEKEKNEILKEKNEAVRNLDFKKAAKLLDQEEDLQNQISSRIAQSKEMNKAEVDSGDRGPTVSSSDICHVVAAWTGIPVDKVSSDESKQLLSMESTLHHRVIGQDEAVKAISRAMRRGRAGLKSPNRPIASLFFSGPTGVGKSEISKALAASFFGSEKYMVRLDMSEFMESHTVSKLIGSPPGYVGYSEGGQLTEAVRRKPYTVVLFDEIEKAHPDVFNLMLQVLEDGRLTDSKGRTVDFKNTLLIMTSNVGSSVIEKGGRIMGFDPDYDEKDSSYSRIKNLVNEELKNYFKPEFLNRLDEIIVFRQLTKLEVSEIAGLMLREIVERLRVKRMELEFTERFKDLIVDKGYDPSYGARPLRRAIMSLLEDPLADKILEGGLKEGDSAIVDIDSLGKVVITVNGVRACNSPEHDQVK